ncbi:MAG: restriction endonuclease subunit M, partial [Nanoarchaeota archaeon]|nr:restriction endonuclease subunit M [Nanoarchaeota archaeon]
IKAVVSLPQVTFEPYTSTKTSLLFAQKKTSKEIEKWNEVWTKYSNDYSKLKTRIENYLKVYIEGKDKSKYPSIKDDNDDTIKSNLFKLLKNFVDENDKKLPIKELIEKYKEEIIDLLKFDNDLVDYFGHVNIWWVFGEVSKETDYDIFMAEVENVGYKRTKRGEKSMPNELFQVNEQGEIVIDTQNPKTALDYLRKQVKWD